MKFTIASWNNPLGKHYIAGGIKKIHGPRHSNSTPRNFSLGNNSQKPKNM